MRKKKFLYKIAEEKEDRILCNRESVKEFLDNSKKESISEFSWIDNFSPHKSAFVKEKPKELEIYLVYLPPYSPDFYKFLNFMHFQNFHNSFC